MLYYFFASYLMFPQTLHANMWRSVKCSLFERWMGDTPYIISFDGRPELSLGYLVSMDLKSQQSPVVFQPLSPIFNHFIHIFINPLFYVYPETMLLLKIICIYPLHTLVTAHHKQHPTQLFITLDWILYFLNTPCSMIKAK